SPERRVGAQMFGDPQGAVPELGPVRQMKLVLVLSLAGDALNAIGFGDNGIEDAVGVADLREGDGERSNLEFARDDVEPILDSRKKCRPLVYGVRHRAKRRLSCGRG